MILHRLIYPEHILMLLRKDELYKNITKRKELDNWLPDLQTHAWFAVEENNNFIAIVMIHARDTNLMEYHGGIYKEYRKESSRILRDVLEELRKNFNCKFMTEVISTNVPGIRINKKIGMIEKCRIKNGDNNNYLIIFAEE